MDEAQLALAALRALASPSQEAAVDALAGIAKRHDLASVATTLDRGFR
jgi:hypothetical protein